MLSRLSFSLFLNLQTLGKLRLEDTGGIQAKGKEKKLRVYYVGRRVVKKVIWYLLLVSFMHFLFLCTHQATITMTIITSTTAPIAPPIIGHGGPAKTRVKKCGYCC